MNIFQEVEADLQKAYTAVKGGLVYLEHEGEVVLAWVEHQAPELAPAISAFLHEAEADAADLARHAAAGLQVQVEALIDGSQTQLLNLIQSTHLADAEKGTLKALDVSGVTLLKTLAQKASSVALAQLLGKLAPTIVAAVL